MFRVSEVESFRRWRDDDDSEFETIIDALTHGIQATEAMTAGTAFHKALETALEGTNDCLEAQGYRFEFPSDLELVLPPIRELRMSKTYMVDGLPIVITGQVDALDGRLIYDHKTTRHFDPDRYMQGFQWRLYLDIFGADFFCWNIFEISEKDTRLYEVKGLHTLTQYRYPELAEDCKSLVSDFARFVRQHIPQRKAA